MDICLPSSLVYSYEYIGVGGHGTDNWRCKQATMYCISLYQMYNVVSAKSTEDITMKFYNLHAHKHIKMKGLHKNYWLLNMSCFLKNHASMAQSTHTQCVRRLLYVIYNI